MRKRLPASSWLAKFCLSSYPSPCAVSVHEIYQTVYGSGEGSLVTAASFNDDPLYSEPLIPAKICQSSPAVVDQRSQIPKIGLPLARPNFPSRHDVYRPHGSPYFGPRSPGSGFLAPRRRNRIITNPRLFVQEKIKFTEWTKAPDGAAAVWKLVKLNLNIFFCLSFWLFSKSSHSLWVRVNKSNLFGRFQISMLVILET